MILDCDGYLNLYKNKWNECYEEALENKSEDPSYDATMLFEEGCTPEEVVGYYLFFYEKEALRQWKANIDGIKLSEHSKKVDELLTEVCKKCKDCTMQKRFCNYE